MKRILQQIAYQRQAFDAHPFFARLAKNEPFQQIRFMAIGLTFWVMSYPDLLDTLTDRFTDPSLRSFAEAHRREEAGHDDWFLRDLASLDQPVPTVRALFGREHAAIRAASRDLFVEACCAAEDSARLALLLSIEATSDVFFTRVASYQGFGSPRRPLVFFSQHHLDAEKDHELFGAAMIHHLGTLSLQQPELGRVSATVARAFASFERLLDAIEAAASAPAFERAA